MDEDVLNSLQLTIIDSSLYNKFRPLRYTLYVVCFLLFFLFFRLKSRTSGHVNPSVIELFNLNPRIYFAALIFFVIIAGVLYAYTKNYKRKGTLEISSDYLRITSNDGISNFYPINEIENFKISRGSTVHYAYKETMPPETNDSWLFFKHNSIEHKYEFMISCKNENTRFEEIVQILRKKYAKLYYESI